MGIPDACQECSSPDIDHIEVGMEYTSTVVSICQECGARFGNPRALALYEHLEEMADRAAAEPEFEEDPENSYPKTDRRHLH